MQIEVFAVLKEYFDKQFSVDGNIEDIHSLKVYLVHQNPSVEEVLRTCRFAVEDELVSDSYPLKENDHICIIPPSSGG